MRHVALLLVAIPSLALADGKVEFTGNRTISSDQLRAAISPAVAGTLFDAAGGVQQEILERDLLLVAASIRHALGVSGGELFNITKLDAGKARVKQLAGVNRVVLALVHGSADDRVEIHVEIDG